MKQFRMLARLELINIFGLNEFKYMKDPQGRKRKGLLLFIFGMLGLMLIGYSVAGAVGLKELGLTDKIPFMFFIMAFMSQFMLGAIKAKGQLYREKDMELLAGLPIKGVGVVSARACRMYVEGLLLWFGIYLPGMMVYCVESNVDILFFITLLPVLLICPILPVVFSAWIGIFFASIIAKNRHKILTEVILMIVVVLGMFVLYSVIMSNTGMQGGKSEISDAAREKLYETVRSSIIYTEEALPPLKAASKAFAETDIPGILLYVFVSIASFAVTVAVIGRKFFIISAKLFTSSKHREYQLEAMKENSVMKALLKKEAARYFSSGVYISNTLAGPVIAIAMSVAAAFIDIHKPIALQGTTLSANLAAGIPYIIGPVLSFVAISASSVSLEGKNWWIPKSLPVSSKTVLSAKVIFNLLVLAPFFGLVELIMLFTVRVSLLERLWLILIPLVTIVYSALLGLMLNIKFPKFKWESETEVVKQSAASGLSFLLIFPVLIMASGAMVIPEEYRNLMNPAAFLLLTVISYVLYHKLCKVRLERLG